MIAVALITLILVSQFNSAFKPIIIIMTVLFSTIGVFLGLAIFNMDFVIIMTGIGIVSLAGIVVNNAIVLVDYTNLLRTRGIAPREAVLTACSIRLRPILMTTATTVLGLFPMAIGLGDGAEIRTPMAIAVIFGLISSTILTLIVVPTIYHLLDRKVPKAS